MALPPDYLGYVFLNQDRRAYMRLALQSEIIAECMAATRAHVCRGVGLQCRVAAVTSKQVRVASSSVLFLWLVSPPLHPV
jgi:hypothetical protein